MKRYFKKMIIRLLFNENDRESIRESLHFRKHILTDWRCLDCEEAGNKIEKIRELFLEPGCIIV